MRALVAFPLELVRLRAMIWAMARRELAARYAGTLGGMVWAVLQPLAVVGVFWFVFSVGFKAQGPGGAPFITYFLAGYIPWLLFSEVLQTSVPSVVANAHLVKKTLFPTQILPLVQLVSSGVTHAVLLVVLLAGLAAGGALSATAPHVVYYFGALCCLTLGLSWTLAAIQVFHRDVAQILTVVLNLWFWLTPIVWTEDVMPAEFRWAIDWNPVHYVVAGYRGALMGGLAPWHDPVAALRFWVVALPALMLGIFVFRRLKPDFADVL